MTSRNHPQPDPATPPQITATDGTPIRVDAGDVALVARHRWYPVPVQGGASVYAAKMGASVIYLAHLIFGTRNRDGVVTFRDKDPRNCRRDNLVLVDSGTSRHRASQPKRGRATTSEYRGVVRDRRNGRTRASIGVDGRRIYLGQFADEIEAAREYDRAARHHYGSNAILNFPEGEK